VEKSAVNTVVLEIHPIPYKLSEANTVEVRGGILLSVGIDYDSSKLRYRFSVMCVLGCTFVEFTPFFSSYTYQIDFSKKS
jgi:hypothetical protein